MTEEEAKTKCDKPGCSEPSVTNLDSANLCQKHADEWVRGEGAAAAEYPDCDGEGWFRGDDGALIVCYGNKCH